MEVLLSSLIIIIFGSIIFVFIESTGFKTKADFKYADIIIKAVWNSRIYLIVLTIIHFIISIVCLLYIFNFILLNNDNYNFIIFKTSQINNFISIIFYFCLSFIFMFFIIYINFRYNKILLDHESNIKKKLNDTLLSFNNFLNDIEALKNKIDLLDDSTNIKKDTEKLFLEINKNLKEAKIYLLRLTKEDKEAIINFSNTKFKESVKVFNKLIKYIKDKIESQEKISD